MNTIVITGNTFLCCVWQFFLSSNWSVDEDTTRLLMTRSERLPRSNIPDVSESKHAHLHVKTYDCLQAGTLITRSVHFLIVIGKSCGVRSHSVPRYEWHGFVFGKVCAIEKNSGRLFGKRINEYKQMRTQSFLFMKVTT